MRLSCAKPYQDRVEDPLVSIIIATYDRGKILVERTIPSILNQTYQNFEVIIVGDCCIDNTAELISRIKDPRINFYNLPKRGKYPTDAKLRWFVQGVVPRNKGMKLARGMWFAWISDDDIMLPDHLNSLLEFAQNGDYEFVSAIYTYEDNGEIKIQDVKNAVPRIGGMQTWLYRSYLKFFKWNIHSWRKSWDCPCDYDLQFRMYNAGVKIGFLEEVVAHVPHVEGTSTVGIKAQLELDKKC
jgi:glycosyltransferase involved in cell wall biosynthesis